MGILAQWKARARQLKAETYAVHSGDWVPPDEADVPAYIAVRCQVCGTRLVATEEQVGQQIECPDCGTAATVPPPSEKPAPARPSVVLTDDIYAIYNGEGQPPPTDQAVYGRYIAVNCGRCRTRMLAAEAQVGEKLICPDCGSATIVPPPQDKPTEAWSGPAEIYQTCDEIGQPAPGSVAYQQHYPFKCPTCHTRLHATADQAGREIACPDCSKPIRIPPPPTKAAGPVWRDEPDEPPEAYDLGLPIAPPPVVVSGFEPVTAEKPLRRSETSSSDIAEEDAAEGIPRPVAPSRPDRPARPPWDGKPLGFLFYPGVRMCWLMIAAGLAAVMAVLGEAFELIGRDDPRTYFIGMMYIAVSGVLGLFGFVAAAPYLLAILHDTAEGCDQIENWPEAVYHDWMLHGVNFVVAAGIAILIGEGAERLLVGAGSPPGLAVGLGTFLLFPVFLLSVLETGTPFLPFSSPVWRSLVAAWPGWALFYLQTAVLVAVTGAAAGYGLAVAGCWAVLPGAAVLAAGVLLYFRLLGRLARYCGRRMNDGDEPKVGRSSRDK